MEFDDYGYSSGEYLTTYGYRYPIDLTHTQAKGFFQQMELAQEDVKLRHARAVNHYLIHNIDNLPTDMDAKTFANQKIDALVKDQVINKNFDRLDLPNVASGSFFETLYASKRDVEMMERLCNYVKYHLSSKNTLSLVNLEICFKHFENENPDVMFNPLQPKAPKIADLEVEGVTFSHQSPKYVENQRRRLNHHAFENATETIIQAFEENYLYQTEHRSDNWKDKVYLDIRKEFETSMATHRMSKDADGDPVEEYYYSEGFAQQMMHYAAIKALSAIKLQEHAHTMRPRPMMDYINARLQSALDDMKLAYLCERGDIKIPDEAFDPKKFYPSFEYWAQQEEFDVTEIATINNAVSQRLRAINESHPTVSEAVLEKTLHNLHTRGRSGHGY